MTLTFWQRLQLLLRGYAYSHHEKRPGWKDALPIYVVKCPEHGLYEDYPHGYSGYFRCPECAKETRKDAV